MRIANMPFNKTAMTLDSLYNYRTKDTKKKKANAHYIPVLWHYSCTSLLSKLGDSTRIILKENAMELLYAWDGEGWIILVPANLDK